MYQTTHQDFNRNHLLKAPQRISLDTTSLRLDNLYKLDETTCPQFQDSEKKIYTPPLLSINPQNHHLIHDYTNHHHYQNEKTHHIHLAPIKLRITMSQETYIPSSNVENHFIRHPLRGMTQQSSSAKHQAILTRPRVSRHLETFQDQTQTHTAQSIRPLSFPTQLTMKRTPKADTSLTQAFASNIQMRKKIKSSDLKAKGDCNLCRAFSCYLSNYRN